ncbi:MAG: hypothetical protein J7J25_03460 [Candidatus Omnitrophica bacterium]|nr:hypothetical protein [Candidatus Omnitrophota bacterium]
MSSENSVEVICRQIETAAKKEAEEIVEAARQKAESILKGAEEKLKEKEELFQKKIDKLRQEKEKSVLSYLRLAEKRARLSSFEEVFREVLVSLEEEKENFRHGPLYRDTLKQLAKEGVEVLGQERIRVIVSSYEKEALGEEFKTELEEFLRQSFSFLKEIEVVFSDVYSDLGAVVEEKEGRVLFDNTFSQRQRRAYNEIRKIVYERLYGA